MNLITISNMLIPIIMLSIIIYALKKKVPIYDSFVNGAKEGLELGLSILPNLVAMLFATNILLKSGIIDNIFIVLKPIFTLLKVPIEVLPMALIRPISGNASFAIMIDLIRTHGVDSFIGRIAATMQGATDTTIYVIALYFGSIGIKKTKYALPVGLLTDLFAVIISIVLVTIIFG
jgi:Uncharacterized membrane protein